MSDLDYRDSAGIIVFQRKNDQTEVLMIRQGKTHFSFPKGHIETGETKEEAAIRETLEETGIKAKLIPDFCFPVPSSRPQDKRMVFFFAGVYSAGSLRTQAGETTDVFWAPAWDVPRLVSFSKDFEAYSAAEKVFNTFIFNSPRTGKDCP